MVGLLLTTILLFIVLYPATLLRLTLSSWINLLVFLLFFPEGRCVILPIIIAIVIVQTAFKAMLANRKQLRNEAHISV